MTGDTVKQATALVQEIESLPEPQRTAYVNMMRHVLIGLRLKDTTQQRASAPSSSA